MEAGLDSLGAVELRNQLANAYPALQLPATLTFDYPSIGALSGFVSNQQSHVKIHVSAHDESREASLHKWDATVVSKVVLQIIEDMLGKSVELSQV